MTCLRWINCAVVAMVLLAACENSGPERDFERMVNQSYFQVYKECDFFPDRRAMRARLGAAIPLAARRVRLHLGLRVGAHANLLEIFRIAAHGRTGL